MAAEESPPDPAKRPFLWAMTRAQALLGLLVVAMGTLAGAGFTVGAYAQHLAKADDVRQLQVRLAEVESRTNDHDHYIRLLLEQSMSIARAVNAQVVVDPRSLPPSQPLPLPHPSATEAP